VEKNTITGIDLAKNIMHFVITDKNGKVLKRFKTKREDFLQAISELEPNTLIAMEACSSSNYWAQEINKMSYKVKLMKTKDVKIYAKSKQKNDYNDALAVAKAARDPELQTVRPKSKAEQDISLLHKTRQNTIRDRVQKTNSLMSSLCEYGYVTKLSKSKFSRGCCDEVEKAYQEKFLHKQAYELLIAECQEIILLCKKEKLIDKLIVESNKQSEKAIKLQKIFGIGPINASCLSNAPMENYATQRDFAASLGLVPRQYTSGDDIVLGSITKQGDRYVRTMLVQAGRSIAIRAKTAKNPTDKLLIWAQMKFAEGKHFNLICVALANKLARIAYAVIMNDTEYKEA
jgi:transposase